MKRSSGVGSRVIGVALLGLMGGHGAIEPVGPAGLTKSRSNTSSAAPTIAASRPRALGTRSIAAPSCGGHADGDGVTHLGVGQLEHPWQVPAEHDQLGLEQRNERAEPVAERGAGRTDGPTGVALAAVGPIEELVERARRGPLEQGVLAEL